MFPKPHCQFLLNPFYGRALVSKVARWAKMNHWMGFFSNFNGHPSSSRILLGPIAIRSITRVANYIYTLPWVRRRKYYMASILRFQSQSHAALTCSALTILATALQRPLHDQHDSFFSRGTFRMGGQTGDGVGLSLVMKRTWNMLKLGRGTLCRILMDNLEHAALFWM